MFPLANGQLGPYRLLRRIGGGGMGEVYLAEDTRLGPGRQVAIKTIRAEVDPYPDEHAIQDAQRLFKREMQVIARLDHPYILPLYDFGEEQIDDTILTYMVMPFRPEGSLNTWLQKRGSGNSMSLSETMHFIEQAAQALQHAHAQQLIHQDVKPANFLMRDRSDQPLPDILLSDFGIVKIASATASASQNIRGTPSYMAPEQWNGQPVPATDQYALAVMAFLLLTRQFPFKGGMEQVMRQHLDKPAPAPSSINPSIPPDVDTVIQHALRKAPEQRFASILAFANAFKQAVQSTPATAFPLPETVKPLPLPDIAIAVSPLSPGPESGHEALTEQSTPVPGISSPDAPTDQSPPSIPVPERGAGFSHGSQAEPVPLSASGEGFPVSEQAGSLTPMPEPFPPSVSPELAARPAAEAVPTIYAEPGSIPPTVAASPGSGVDFQAHPIPVSEQGIYQAPPATPQLPMLEIRSNRQQPKRRVILLALLGVLLVGLISAALIHQNQSNTNSNSYSTFNGQSGDDAQSTVDAQPTIDAQSTVDAQSTADAQATTDAQATVDAQSTADAQATAQVVGDNPCPSYIDECGSLSLALLDPLQDEANSDWSSSSYCNFTNNGFQVRDEAHYYTNCLGSHSYSNVVFEIHLTAVQGDCGGLVVEFDGSQQSGYLFLVCPYGIGNVKYAEYRLVKYIDSSGTDSTILTSGSSDAINASGDNLLAIGVQDGTISLYVNQQKIDSVNNTSFTSGSLGPASNGFDNATIATYTDARVWD